MNALLDPILRIECRIKASRIKLLVQEKSVSLVRRKRECHQKHIPTMKEVNHKKTSQPLDEWNEYKKKANNYKINTINEFNPNIEFSVRLS